MTLHYNNGRAPGYPRDPLDWYVEPTWSVGLLFEAERFEGSVCDPACGIGTIPLEAQRRGHAVLGLDIMERWRLLAAQPPFPFVRADFLRCPLAPGSVDNVVCNPPYSYKDGIAEDYARLALKVARRAVALLVPVSFTCTQRRYLLFKRTPLYRTYFCSSRPSMPPGKGYVAGDIAARGGSIDYCWMVWRHGHEGLPTQDWLILPDDLHEQWRNEARRSA